MMSLYGCTQNLRQLNGGLRREAYAGRRSRGKAGTVAAKGMSAGTGDLKVSDAFVHKSV